MIKPNPSPYEDNTVSLNIMTAGHITRRLRHVAVLIVIIIHKDLRNRSAKQQNRAGKFNPADLGTKPLPDSDQHRI